MRIARRIGMAIVTVALAAGSGGGHAADPPKQGADPPVDQGLWDCLGGADPSSDSTEPDDGSWLAYLSQVNLGQAAKASQAPQAPTQPKSPDPAAGGDKPSG